MKHILVALLLSLSFTSCDKLFNGDEDDYDDGKCPGVMCTEEFRMITVQITDFKGNPDKLKDYTAYITSSKKVLAKFEDDHFGEEGYYLIATDGDMKYLSTEGTEITIEGETKSGKYFKRTFLIGKDCCHIQQKDDQSLVIVL